jgi:rare lipoprotein A
MDREPKIEAGFGSTIMKVKLLRALVWCIAALAVGTALFSVSAASRQVCTINSRFQKGRAAFYSRALEGHKTACGGKYVASELTTAHRSLPCGTRVRITNTKNGKSVEATVNDWGPTSRNRIVDVSRAVAEKLDFVKQGTTTVKVEVVQ